MNDDRRSFIRAAGKLGIASALLPQQLLAGLTASGHTEISRQGFQDRVNDWFYLHDDELNHGKLELINVTDEGSCRDVEQFSLTFRSSRTGTMPSGYYRVSGEAFDLFVQRTHRQNGRHFYRADFSLLTAARQSSRRS